MPSEFLRQILEDIEDIPFSARYLPVPVEERPVSGCVLPARLASRVHLPVLPVFDSNLDCNTNFIPVPIIPTPFIPSFPCETGFIFESQYPAAVSDTLTVAAANQLDMAGFTVADDLGFYEYPDGAPLPEIEIYQLLTSSGTGGGGQDMYDVVDLLMYYVRVDNPEDPAHAGFGVKYIGEDTIERTFTHGQTFLAHDPELTAEVADSAQNAYVSLLMVQRARVVDYDRTPPGAYVVTEEPVKNIAGGTLAGSTVLDDFIFRRIVVGASNNKLTGGSFTVAPLPCGGRLIGEINLNLDDLGIPCTTGFHFDALYHSAVDEDITTSVDGLKVNPTTPSATFFPSRIPHGISPDTGLTYPLPKLHIISTGASARVTAVDDGTGEITLDAALPISTTYNGADWYLERIIVTTGTNSGNFEFVATQCGGTLVGQISIDPGDLTTPCTTQLASGGMVNGTGGGGTPLSFINYLNPSSTDYDPSGEGGANIAKKNDVKIDSTPTTSGGCTTYLLDFDGSPFILPDIEIKLNGAPMTKTRTDKKVTYEGTVESGTGGGSTGGTSCVGCCRWS